MKPAYLFQSFEQIKNAYKEALVLWTKGDAAQAIRIVEHTIVALNVIADVGAFCFHPRPRGPETPAIQLFPSQITIFAPPGGGKSSLGFMVAPKHELWQATAGFRTAWTPKASGPQASKPPTVVPPTSPLSPSDSQWLTAQRRSRPLLELIGAYFDPHFDAGMEAMPTDSNGFFHTEREKLHLTTRDHIRLHGQLSEICTAVGADLETMLATDE